MPLIAFDASNLIARYYHANPDVTGPAIMKAAWRIAKSHGATKIAAALDAPVSWRSHLFRGHKEGRTEKPPELRALLGSAARLFADAGIPVRIGHELEADDVLGAMAERYSGRVLIWSNDKDLYTCLSERVSVISGTTMITPEVLVKKYSVTPVQWPLYRAVTGDPSDGHSGIPGLGPVAARTICAQATTAQSALEWAARTLIPARTEATLLEHAEQLRLYETLARLRTDGTLLRPG